MLAFFANLSAIEFIVSPLALTFLLLVVDSFVSLQGRPINGGNPKGSLFSLFLSSYT